MGTKCLPLLSNHPVSEKFSILYHELKPKILKDVSKGIL